MRLSHHGWRPIGRLRWHLVALGLMLPWASVVASSWLPFVQIGCAGGSLEIDARPHTHNEAGGMSLELRYRYRGQLLDAVRYERFHHNLDRYRLRDPERSYNFGLNLDTSGLSDSGSSERGDTLYLPPARAASADARSLADCIAAHRALLRNRLRDGVVISQSFLGLMRNSATPQLDGIARLIHAESPFVGIYQHTHLVVILRDGRVIAHTGYTANNPSDAVQIGQILQGGAGQPALRLRPHYHLGGKLQNARHLYLWPHHRSGRALQDDYRIELEASP